MTSTRISGTCKHLQDHPQTRVGTIGHTTTTPRHRGGARGLAVCSMVSCWSTCRPPRCRRRRSPRCGWGRSRRAARCCRPANSGSAASGRRPARFATPCPGRAEVEDYLAQQEREGAEIQTRIEAAFPPEGCAPICSPPSNRDTTVPRRREHRPRPPAGVAAKDPGRRHRARAGSRTPTRRRSRDP